MNPSWIGAICAGPLGPPRKGFALALAQPAGDLPACMAWPSPQWAVGAGSRWPEHPRKLRRFSTPTSMVGACVPEPGFGLGGGLVRKGGSAARPIGPPFPTSAGRPLPPWWRRRADELELLGRPPPHTTPGRVKPRRLEEPEEQRRRYARESDSRPLSRTHPNLPPQQLRVPHVPLRTTTRGRSPPIRHRCLRSGAGHWWGHGFPPLHCFFFFSPGARQVGPRRQKPPSRPTLRL